MRKPYTLHGKRSQYGTCDDTPTCPRCGTGMVCNHGDASHFCGYRECNWYVGDVLMTAYREIMREMGKGR